MKRPERDESASRREVQDGLERPDPPRDQVEVAMFKGMGQAITISRERLDMTREELAQNAEMPVAELKRIESGNLNERWGDLGRVADGLGMPLPELFVRAEEHAPGPGGEKWRQRSGEAESGSTVPGARSDAAEGRKRT